MIDWKAAGAFAKRYGVKNEAFKKWSQRGIPHKWRLALVARTNITAADMRAHDRAIKRKRGKPGSS
jgi:hypothetical protein